MNIGQLGREIVEDPGKNAQRLCEVGTGYSPSHEVKKKKVLSKFAEVGNGLTKEVEGGGLQSAIIG